MIYDVGDVVTVSTTVRDGTGALANAGTMTCTVTAPDGTTSSPTPANPTTGNYTATVTATMAGQYIYRFVATGANACAHTDSFIVTDEVGAVGLADLKAHLNITSTSSDDELRATLLAATTAAEAYLHRPLRRSTRSQTFTMPRGNQLALVLTSTDIATITAVSEDGTTLTADDYRLEQGPGVLWRYPIGRRWSYPTTVTYTVAGLTNPAIRQAVLELARHLWETQRGTMPMLPRDTEAYMPPSNGYAMPNRVVELLAPFRMPL